MFIGISISITNPSAAAASAPSGGDTEPVYETNISGAVIDSVTDNPDGTTTIILSGTDAGAYVVQTADIASGAPVLLRPAVWVETGTAGTYALTEPLWLVPQDDPAVFVQTIVDDLGNQAVFASPFTADPVRGYTYTYGAENFAGSVTPAPVTIKAAPQYLLGFSDSAITINDTGARTRQATAAYRITFDRAARGVAGNLYLGDLGNITTGTALRIRMKTFLADPRDVNIDDSSPITFSVVVASDLDGNTRLDLNLGAGWTTELSGPVPASSETVIGQQARWGSKNNNTAGPNFTLHQQLWQTNAVPADFEALRDALFAANGEWNELPANGAAAGIAPLFFLRGDDFTTPANSGTSNEVPTLGRNPITVTVI